MKLNLSSTALNPFPLDCDPCKQLFPSEKLGNKNKLFLSQSIIDLVTIERHYIVIVYEFIIKVIKVVQSDTDDLDILEFPMVLTPESLGAIS